MPPMPDIPLIPAIAVEAAKARVRAAAILVICIGRVLD
jgi:hypothetical protein